MGLHTLCLLDIKVSWGLSCQGLLRKTEIVFFLHLFSILLPPMQVKEPNLDMLARGKILYEPPRYMTINTALEQLLEVRGELKTTTQLCGYHLGWDKQPSRAHQAPSPNPFLHAGRG